MFTTRPDTSFGMTFCVLAPEHPLVAQITTDEHRAEVEAFVDEARNTAEIDRLSSEGAIDKRGCPRARTRCNPFTGEPVPIFLADYVLSTYGTGAIMAVPGQDQRDWDFATAYRPADHPDGPAAGGLRRRRATPATVRPSTARWLDGLDVAEAKAKAIDWLEAEGIGERKVNYRLRDWLLSRQRFWGCPIPIVYCPDHGAVPVPDDQLPDLAPDDVEFLPTGESPLQLHEGFLQHHLPARAAVPPRARPTRWTPSSTRRGTSCASATRGTRIAPST